MGQNESVRTKMSYLDDSGKITQCSVFPWLHNFKPEEICFHSLQPCRKFRKVIPLHPHPVFECLDRKRLG